MPDEVNLNTRDNVFTRWANHILAERQLHIEEGQLCRGALKDGIILCNLVELVTKRVMFRWKIDPQTRLDYIQYAPPDLSNAAAYIGIVKETYFRQKISLGRFNESHV